MLTCPLKKKCERERIPFLRYERDRERILFLSERAEH